MAEPSLNTRLSRRSMLAGGAAAVIPSIASPPVVGAGAEDDARIAALALRYRKTTTALVDWVTEAERRHGPLAYENRPEYRARYAELVARDRLSTAALAQARPTSLRGVVLKLRPAFYCDSLYGAEADCDADILLSALHDLERLTEAFERGERPDCLSG